MYLCLCHEIDYRASAIKGSVSFCSDNNGPTRSLGFQSNVEGSRECQAIENLSYLCFGVF